MTLQLWGSAAFLVAASVLVGHALNLLGARCRAAAPAVGLSVLVVLADVTLKLPGRGTTAAIIMSIVLLAAAGVVLRGRASVRVPVIAMIAGLAGALGASIPFISNGRVGLLGVSLDNDTATHLQWAEALLNPVVGRRYGFNDAYPLGPHSVVDVLGSGLGVRLDMGFTGLMVATVILTAIVGASALRGEAGWKRVVTGLLASLLFLVAAYYAEGAFKEQLMGLLLLALVLHLEEVRETWIARSRSRWGVLLPVSFMVAGAIYIYSYPALAWIGLTLVIWLAAELVTAPGRLRRRREQVLDLLGPTAAGIGAIAVMVAPAAGRIVNFAQGVGLSPAGTGVVSATNLGNLAYPLSPYEAFGIWSQIDFRFLPSNVFHAGELSALALGVVLLGVVWSLGRRELVLPAALGACAIVYWRASHGQSPYLSAKALVIPGPVVAVTALRGLLRSPKVHLSRWASVSRLAVAIAFVSFAAHSSYQALRDEPVWPPESTNELLSLDKLTRNQTVLFLGHSDYAPWLFGDSKMSALASDTVSLAQARARADKPYVYGTDLDFDTVDPATINRFRWLITTNTTYASQPPNGLRLVRQLRMYDLWERLGVIQPRQVIEPPGTPGAVLDCRTPRGRALSRRRGVAAVTAGPMVVALSGLPPGGEQRVTLRLPAGRWDLSLQYTSAVDLEVSAALQHWQVPAYLDRPGPVFGVGSLTTSGAPIVVTVRADRPSFISGSELAALTSSLIATRSPETRVLVPLRHSCGRYVDWYRVSG